MGADVTCTLNKNRYRKMSEAYTIPPPKTSAEAAMLVATAMSTINGANVEVTCFQNIQRATTNFNSVE